LGVESVREQAVSECRSPEERHMLRPTVGMILLGSRPVGVRVCVRGSRYLAAKE
jgi:hypothetical protein